MSSRRDEGQSPYCWNAIGVWGDMSCVSLSKYSHCSNCPTYLSEGRGFFEKPANRRAENGAEAAALAPQDTGRKPYFVFETCSRWVALELRRVLKVERSRMIHRIPHRDPSVVRGLANIGGELLVCVSLSGLLSLECSQTPDSARSRMVVCRNGNDRFVFTADSVRGVVRFPEGSRVSKASESGGISEDFVDARFNMDGREVCALDASLLFETVVKRHL